MTGAYKAVGDDLKALKPRRISLRWYVGKEHPGPKVFRLLVRTTYLPSYVMGPSANDGRNAHLWVGNMKR